MRCWPMPKEMAKSQSYNNLQQSLHQLGRIVPIRRRQTIGYEAVAELTIAIARQSAKLTTCVPLSK